jgi:outer membrane biogenesis lipoprotein LolB
MKVILLLSAIFLLSACKNASRQVQVQQDSAAVLQTSVDTQSRYFKQTANRIGLVIPTVKDSFVLRLWINSMMKPDHVIELRKSGKDWVSKKFIYYFQPDGRLMFK